MNKGIKVCHLTTAHDPDDIRIFHKECVSLAKNGYDVTLVAINCDEYELKGVKVLSVSVDKSTRLKRFLNAAKPLYKKALEIDADIYHFHDPEFMFSALKLQRHGKKVIYDSHEDYPRNMKTKHWVPNILKPLATIVVAQVEKYVLARLSANIGVNPQIVERIKIYNPNTYLVTNYPLLDNSYLERELNTSSRKAVYAGTISPHRVMHNILDAADQVEDLEIILAGAITTGYDTVLKAKPAWERVDFRGYLTFEAVLDLYKDCLFGLSITDYDFLNYGNQGTLGVTKTFEYMMMGMPFIVSDLIHYKDFIEKYKCAITVNPRNVDEIAAAMQFFMDNPEEAKQMGERGRQAAIEHYNWNSQEKVLLEMYSEIVKTLN